jgi:hypothetical protein
MRGYADILYRFHRFFQPVAVRFHPLESRSTHLPADICSREGVHGTARFQSTNQTDPVPAMAAALPRRCQLLQLGLALAVLLAATPAAEAWTGEIRGRVVCDVCGDAAIGPEDHALEGQSAPYNYLMPPRADLSIALCAAVLWFPSWVSCNRSSESRISCFRFRKCRPSTSPSTSSELLDEKSSEFCCCYKY